MEPLLDHHWVASLRRRVLHLCAPSDSKATIALVADWGIVSGLTLLIWLMLGEPLFLLVYPLCATVIASRFRGMENLVHEASHRNLFAKRNLNTELHWFFATPVFRVVEDYRKSHLDHHHELGNINVDPDTIRYRRLGVTRFHLFSNRLWIYFIRPLLGYHVGEFLRTTFMDFWRAPQHRAERIGFWIIVLLVVAIAGLWKLFLLCYAIPFFGILSVLRFWAEAAKHSGLDLNDPISSARNNIGWFHRLFLHPHNDGFHAVHHLLPTIPWYNLPAAFEELMKDPIFDVKCVQSKGFWETFRDMGRKEIQLKKDKTPRIKLVDRQAILQ